MLLLLYKKAPVRGIRGSALYFLLQSESTVRSRVVRARQFLKEFPLHPRAVDAVLLLSHALADSGHINSAIRHLDLCLKKRSSLRIRFRLSKLLIKTGAFKSALVHLRILSSGRAEFHDRAGVFYCRAYARYKLGRYPAAIRLFRRVAGKYRGSRWQPSSVYYLGRIAELKKRLREAARLYRQVLRDYPNSLSALSARSRLLMISRYLPAGKKVRVYEIQLAALASRKYALRYVEVLRKKRITAYLFTIKRSGKNRYTVRTGYYRTRKAAEKALKRLRAVSSGAFIRRRTVKLSGG